MQKTSASAKDLMMSEHDQVLKILEDLYHQSCSVLAQNNVSHRDAQALALSVAEVRRLLTELTQIKIRLQRDNRIITRVVELKEQYWELEGLVKETRNTLARTAGAA